MSDPTRENSIIALAVSRPVAMLMVTTAVVVFGGICLSRLPMDLMPELDYPSVTVRTEYPGAAPEDVEDRVSRRLEQALSVVKGVRRITSISRAEQSDVILEFAWESDISAGVQDIREKLDQTFLPDQAETPTILRYDPSLDPILQVGLTGPFEEQQLRHLAEEEIERRLETVEGVAAVKVRGGREREIRVEVREEPARLRGVTIEEISRRLAEENIDQASGLLSEGNVTYVVRTRNEFRDLDEIERIPIRREGDSYLRLRDVARVVESVEEPEVITRIDGEPAVKIEIYREAGANIVALAERVKARLYGTEKEQERFRKWKQQRAASESERSAPEEPDTAAGDRSDGGNGTEDETDDETEADTEADVSAGDADTETAQNRDDEKREDVVLSRPDFVVAYLPEGCRVDVLSDQSVFIAGSITDLRSTAILGGVLAIAVLYLFLRRFLFTAVVAVSIPLSVIATFAPLYLGGISLNLMSLGGLALGVGMLVDSSIVVLESIFRRREAGESARDAAVRGASDVSGAVVASTLTTIAVFFPIVFVEGMAAQIFRDQALTVVYALIASLLVSLTLIPMLAARLPSWDAPRRGGAGARRYYWKPVFPERFNVGDLRLILTLPFLIVATVIEWIGYALFTVILVVALALRTVVRVVAWIGARLSAKPVALFNAGFGRLESAYGTLLRGALSQRMVVIGAGAAAIVLGALAYRELGSELIPDVAQGEFVVHVTYPVGTRIERTSAEVAQYERQIADLPTVDSVSTTVGVDAEDIAASSEGSHTAKIRVRLGRSRESLAVQEERVRAEIHRIFAGASDHQIDFTRPTLFSFTAPLEIEVRGHDLTQLRQVAETVAATVRQVPAVVDVRSTVARGNPEYHLIPNRDRMARYDVTGQQLADVTRRKNMGEVATQLREADEKIDVRVRLAEEDRDSIDELLAMQIKPGVGRGEGWRLEDLLSDVEQREGPAEIRRVNQQRAAIVSASLEGLDLGTTSERVERAIYRALPDLPADISIEVVGQKKEMERSRASLIGALLLAVFLVYVVMASQFESLVQPFVILFTIPLASVGVTVTLWLTGTPLSITAFIGMILLAGIVVNNAIVLIDQVNRFRRESWSTRDALVAGSQRRLRPIAMTTLTTMLAMVPLTGILSGIPHDPAWDPILGSGQGAEIRGPMAYTVIGGLLTSTLLTLVVVPVVYSFVVRDRAPDPATAIPDEPAGEGGPNG